MKKLLQIFKNPSAPFLIAIYIVTLLSCVGSVLILMTDYTHLPFSVIAYTLFFAAAVSLSYTVYTIVRFRSRIKESITGLVNKSKLMSKFVSNFGFRTLSKTTVTFFLSIFYGLFNGILGIISLSIWYGALSFYYIMLALIYGNLIKHRISSKSDSLKDLKAYRNTGVLLLMLNLGLSAAIAQMIFSNQAFKYSGLMIYVSATFAFFKITMAIINFVKNRHQLEMSLRAIININLTSGAVSILALQTALLSAFGDGSVDVSLFNTLTGSVVSILSLGIGIFMIIKGNKMISTEKMNER